MLGTVAERYSGLRLPDVHYMLQPKDFTGKMVIELAASLKDFYGPGDPKQIYSKVL